jgi:hypothetical protein
MILTLSLETSSFYQNILFLNKEGKTSEKELKRGKKKGKRLRKIRNSVSPRFQ